MTPWKALLARCRRERPEDDAWRLAACAVMLENAGEAVVIDDVSYVRSTGMLRAATVLAALLRQDAEADE